MRFQKRWVMGWIVLLSGLIAACGAARTPQLVASYPKPSSGGNSSQAFPDGPVVVETVYLALEVNDPDDAADKAARLAYGYGGYEADRDAWYADGGRTVSQEIFVPLDRADNLHARLLQMGWKNRESVDRRSDAWYGPGYGWAQFSIQYLPLRHSIEWDHSLEEDFLRPVYGFFEKAATVIVRLFASLLLAVVVVIPCAMMAVGAVTTIRWLFRR